METVLLNLVLYLLIAVSIGLVVFGLPGTWLLVLGGMGYGLLGGQLGGPGEAYRVIALLVFAALLGEVVEFAVGVLGARRMRVSNGALVSSMVGGLVGTVVGVPIPIVGSVIGLFAGAFAGAFLYELVRRRPVRAALSVASAVLLSRIVAVFFKTTIALLMGIYLILQTL